MSFYLKKYGEPAGHDIYAEWGIRVRSCPPKPYPDLKPLAARDWPDEQGDDEFIPAIPVFASANMTIEFFYEGEIGSIAENVISFLEYLQGGEISFSDEYTGSNGIFRYVSYSDDAVVHDDDDALSFSVTFKLNNPKLNGSI